MHRQLLILALLSISLSACGGKPAPQSDEGSGLKSQSENPSTASNGSPADSVAKNAENFEPSASESDGAIYVSCVYGNGIQTVNYKIDQSNEKAPNISAYDPNQNQYVESRFLYADAQNQPFWRDVYKFDVDDDQIKILFPPNPMLQKTIAIINRSTGSLFIAFPNRTDTIGHCEKSQKMIHKKSI